MKVVLVSSTDVSGGAARAAYRLHRSLLAAGVSSTMLVQSKRGDDPTVVGPESKIGRGIGLVRPEIDSLPLRKYPNRSRASFTPDWLPFSKTVRLIDELAPDVVNLHWIGGGTLRIEQLAHITRPIVWTLHDMWPMTGGCHYDEECGRFKEVCHTCPVLDSSRYRDLSNRIFRRKSAAYEKLGNVAIVGISRWMTQQVKESRLLSRFKVATIANPLDVEVFAPLSKREARGLLGIPSDRKLMLFGAMSPATEPRKGYSVLLEALGRLNMPDVELIVVGSSAPQEDLAARFKVNYLGRLHDDLTLRAAYSAADVVVVPSLQENLSNVIMESLSCGTPVVAFNVGGNSDMIDHLENGYLASPFDPADLATGIASMLNHPDRETVAVKARKKVVREFESGHIAAQYRSYFEELLENTSR